MPDTQTPPSIDKILLTWRAPVHPTFERSKRWYVLGGMFVVACAAYGILTGAWTFTVVILLCGAMYVLTRDHKFPEVAAIISEGGIDLSGTFLSWERIEGFWLLTTPNYTELHIVPKDKKLKEMRIQTGAQNAETLRKLLSEHAQELTDKEERFLDTFIRICKL